MTQEVFSESGPNAVFVTMFDDNGAAINLDPKIVDDSGHKLSSLMSGLQFLPFNLELTSGTHTIYAKFAPPFNEVTGG